MVDRQVLAEKIASVWEAVARIREVLPAERVLAADLAARLAAASGLRNPIAHRYGVLDWNRVHEIASTQLDDLLAFCEALARRASESMRAAPQSTRSGLRGDPLAAEDREARDASYQSLLEILLAEKVAELRRKRAS